MTVFINRTINMKKIKAIGFDMDYTIVRYNTKAFEELTHKESLKKLIEVKNYPKKILELGWDYDRSIQGLVIDKKRGNILKVSRYGKVKHAYHGLEPMNFKDMQRVYRNRVIDLTEDHFQSLDTSFSISNGVLYGQLVALKEEGIKLPDYYTLADDIKEVIDIVHADGSLKGEVSRNIEKFIIQEPELAGLLEKYKDYGKKLLVITNSDYKYCKLLMDYAIKPFLKKHKCWTEVFDITITLARKPSFFTTKTPLLTIENEQGQMMNHFGKMEPGIYQGGWAGKLQEDLGLEGDQILYLGDHIYGDVVSIKKTFNWRTALVLDPLTEEIEGNKKSNSIQKEIDKLMAEKELLEKQINDQEARKYENDEKIDRDELNSLYAKIEKINNQISDTLENYRTHFNPYWGEMMRAGQEESRFADQMEKYACIYMTKIADLLSLSPRTYFRPNKRILPHEVSDE